MKPTVIGIVFSDLHLNLWSRFNEDHSRTKNSFKFLDIIKKACKKYDCPAIFGGDFFHKPENIDNELLDYTVDYFNSLKGNFIVYGISGNHDMNKANNLKITSPSLWRLICKIWSNHLINIDFESVEISKKVFIHGVPYMDHNIGLNEYVKSIQFEEGSKNVLILHTDYPGAKDNDGVEVNSVENLNVNLLNRFDLTLIGHIHKPQRLGRKVFIIGAPYQQRRTDRGAHLGYWKLYDNMTLEFVEVCEFPKFIDVDSEEKKKDDGNYYTVIASAKEIATVEHKVISVGMSKKKTVTRYLKAINENDEDKKKVLLDILKEVDK